MKKVTLTQLRGDIYNIIDEILASGEAVELERHGHVLRIEPVVKKNKFANITPHPDTIIGDPDDIVHIDWLKE